MSGNCKKSVQTQERDMPAVVEARAMLCAVPLDLSRGESKGVWLQRAARLLGVPPAKAKRIYYGEVKRIDADEFARMRARLENLKAQANENRERLNDLIYLRHEIARAGQADREGHQGAAVGGSTVGEGAKSGGGIEQRDRAKTTTRG
jgi:hypothetical protein